MNFLSKLVWRNFVLKKIHKVWQKLLSFLAKVIKFFEKFIPKIKESKLPLGIYS